MKEMIYVGTTELVTLPGSRIVGVPAKIDTGADNSAIWSSNIIEQDNELSFVLFDKSSPFYTGRKLTTNDYRVISVKNSFGQSELRYKVHLKIVLAGRTIKATFTLANREKNKYPILVGRRTLQGKFLVDVSQKRTKQSFDVLMLSRKWTPVTEKFAKNLEHYGKKLRVTYAAYEDLRFVMGAPASHITLLDGGKDIASFDLVIFKTTIMDIAAAAARYLQKRNVPYLDRAIQYFSGDSKLYQYSILTDNDIPVPLSIFMFPEQLKQSYDYLKQQLGLPFILKDIHGSKGDDNYLITSKKTFNESCTQAAQNEAQCIAQAFIANDSDYRVLIFGAKVALIIQRFRRDDTTHLNNTSQGGDAKLVELRDLPPAIQKDCLSAAKLMDRQIAGVDIVQDKISGLWYCLEVNERPQIASGRFVAEKHAAFAAYLERRLTV